MNGVDLKLTAEQAVAQITREAADAVERLRRLTAGFEEQIERSHSVDKATAALVPSAMVAAVIDLSISANVPGGWSLGVSAYGSCGNTQVYTPLPPGRYRALVLIDPLPEPAR